MDNYPPYYGDGGSSNSHSPPLCCGNGGNGNTRESKKDIDLISDNHDHIQRIRIHVTDGNITDIHPKGVDLINGWYEYDQSQFE